MYILFHILFHHGLSQDMECSSLSYTVGPCLSILYIVVEVKWNEMKLLSHVLLFVTPWTVAHKAPLSMEFSRQEYWSGLPFPSPVDLSNPGLEPGSSALQADTLPSESPGKPSPYNSLHLLISNFQSSLLHPQHYYFFLFLFCTFIIVDLFHLSIIHFCKMPRIFLTGRLGGNLATCFALCTWTEEPDVQWLNTNRLCLGLGLFKLDRCWLFLQICCSSPHPVHRNWAEGKQGNPQSFTKGWDLWWDSLDRIKG